MRDIRHSWHYIKTWPGSIELKIKSRLRNAVTIITTSSLYHLAIDHGKSSLSSESPFRTTFRHAQYQINCPSPPSSLPHLRQAPPCQTTLHLITTSATPSTQTDRQPQSQERITPVQNPSHSYIRNQHVHLQQHRHRLQARRPIQAEEPAEQRLAPGQSRGPDPVHRRLQVRHDDHQSPERPASEQMHGLGRKGKRSPHPHPRLSRGSSALALAKRTPEDQSTAKSPQKANPHPPSRRQESGGLDLIFHTNTESGKTDDLHSDPAINIAFLNSSGEWASISGEAAIITDRDVVRKHYSRHLKAWIGDLGDGKHDGGPEDPRIGIIKVNAKTATYAVADRSAVARGFEVAKGMVTGEAPNVQKLRELSEEEIVQCESSWLFPSSFFVPFLSAGVPSPCQNVAKQLYRPFTTFQPTPPPRPTFSTSTRPTETDTHPIIWNLRETNAPVVLGTGKP